MMSTILQIPKLCDSSCRLLVRETKIAVSTNTLIHFRNMLFVLFGSMMFASFVDANSIATLDGKSYISMSVSKQAMYSIQEFIALHIKTRQKNAFLFYTGSQVTRIHMAVYLKDGKLRLYVQNGFQTYTPEHPISCPKCLYSRFDDNQWHSINVTWRKRELTTKHGNLVISVEVDGRMMHRGSLRSEKLLSSRVLYIGGAPTLDIWDFKKVAKDEEGFTNFKGCLRQVLYSPESIQFDLINMARRRLKPVSASGKVIFDQCVDQFAADPITFRTNDAFLKVRASWRSTRRWSLSFRFKTTEEGGLILYQKGNGSNADYLAFELRQSELFLLLNAGSGTKIYNASFRNVTDGKPHLVLLKYKGGKGNVFLDRRKTLSYDLNKNSNRGFREMNMNEHIFVGSLPSTEQVLAPHELWSAKLRKGYVGCFWDLRVDNQQIDLVYETRRQRADQDSAIELYCSSYQTNQRDDTCPTSPCAHGGICKPGWDRFLCDCTNTMWTGYKCQKRAPVLRFDGTQSMMIRLPMELQSEAEDVILRFKTKEKDGLLFGTHSPLSSAQDRMELLIQGGKLVLVLNFGKGNKSKPINAPISDNRWHTVNIQRRKLEVTISLDYDQHIAFDIDKRSSAKLINMRNIAVGYYKEPGQKFGNHFIGHMMHFIFNGVNYFELASTKSPPNIEVTAELTADEDIRPYPINFQQENAYITLPSLEIHNDFKLKFWFRTNRMNGVLLYNAGSAGNMRGDYILLELVAGSLNFVFSVNGVVKRQTSPTGSLDDGRWHQVLVSRQATNGRYNEFIFRVDGQPKAAKASIQIQPDRSRGVSFRLGNPLYLGGVEEYEMNDPIFFSKTGFQGCIAALYLNRPDSRLTNPMYEGTIPKGSEGKIRARCDGPGFQCRPGICYYGGQCIQQWRRVRCNCELTSFTGPQCQQVSSTISFGPGRSRVTLEMLDRSRNTRRDELALGIQTETNEATLVHIVGQGTKRFGYDFIRIDVMVNGFVQVSYNMGSSEHQVTETRQRVNDGRYHIIRLVREGPNTVLKVDEFTERKIPKGPQLSSHFNRQKWIYLGAPRPPEARIRRRSPDYSPYVGIISGMVFNGVAVTDIITGRKYNPHIQIRKEGRVRTYSSFSPNLSDFPPPLTNLTDSPSLSASTMQSTSSDKWRGPTNRTNGTRGIIAPHTDCRPGPSGDCRIVGTGTAIIIPVVKISSTPTLLNKQNSRPNVDGIATPTPSSSNVPVPPPLTHSPKGDVTPSPTSFPIGVGGLNVWLVVAIACGGALVLLLVVCIIYRCRHKADEGSYSVEHHQREFGGDPACKPLRRIPGEGEPLHMNGGATPLESVPSAGDPSIGTFSRSDRSSSGSDRKKKKKKAKPSRKETREWYV